MGMHVPEAERCKQMLKGEVLEIEDLGEMGECVRVPQ